MFDISVLKEMKLSELQEIAKATKKIKFNGVKKEELVYKILDFQAANPQAVESDKSAPAEPKGKRIRIMPNNKSDNREENTLFSNDEPREAAKQETPEVITDSTEPVGYAPAEQPR